MTAVIDAAIERFLEGPAPYSSGNPAMSYLTAQQELAAAFEGQAPVFSKTIADKLGPQLTDELAKVIRRAVAVGIKRRAAQETAELVAGAYDLLVQGLDQVTDGCTTPEDETDHEAEVAEQQSIWEAVSRSERFDAEVRVADYIAQQDAEAEAEAEQSIEICWAPYGRGWLCSRPKPCPEHPAAADA